MTKVHQSMDYMYVCLFLPEQGKSQPFEISILEFFITESFELSSAFRTSFHNETEIAEALER